MEELLKRHMAESDRRFDRIERKLDDLGEFKIALIASARFVSMLVSAVCGAVTFLGSMAVAYFSSKK